MSDIIFEPRNAMGELTKRHTPRCFEVQEAVEVGYNDPVEKPHECRCAAHGQAQRHT